MRVGLVGDVRAQQPRRLPARDLYTSRLFLARRAYVERTCELWYVLSAQHGLLHPDQVIEPYERTFKGAPRATKEQWANRVLWQLDRAWPDWRGTEVEIHAGRDYRNFGLVDGLLDRGAPVTTPAAHLGGGAQLTFYLSSDVIDLTEAAAELEDRYT